MKANEEIQRKRLTNISLKLRKKYYDISKENACYYESPHGIAGNMSESIGAWPEFIFRGTFCKRTFKGYCSPCFYSQFPIRKKEKGEKYIEMIRHQFDYVIDNFDELVVERQYGKYDHQGYITFVLTPTGSYFDDEEFPQWLRLEMLEKLVEKSKDYRERFRLIIECHCKDWNALDFNSDCTKKEIQFIKLLNGIILFGFESADEYVRNVLYNKNLEMTEFEDAYKKARGNGLGIGVFIFAGLFSMNDALTILDVCDSIKFALDREIWPVIMFQNIQQYTITELLFQKNEINLIEPFTVMEIILSLINEFEKREKIQTEWLIADPKGGPPAPEFNIFDCAHITSKVNADRIYNMVCRLRMTRDFHIFKQEAQQLKNTENYVKYRCMLETCFGKNDLPIRTDKLLDCAERILNEME